MGVRNIAMELGIKCYNTLMTRRAEIWLRSLALLLFLAAVFFYSWNSDDAYHSYIMARHLVEGKGLVYNTGYRVSASTCPLLTLIEAFVFLFTDSPDFCGLLIGLLFSGAAAWILFFRICVSPLVVLCMFGLMISSRGFLSFTTSGLENPLLFFFGAVFFDIYHRHQIFSKRHLLVLSFLMSFIAMIRMDSVLVFIPMSVWAYLALTRVSFRARIVIGAAGLLPFAGWMVFSTIYYGFPFPNTYYAKLCAGIPLWDYAAKGLVYLLASCLSDLLLFVCPAIAFALAINNNRKHEIPLFIGLAIYSLYVVSIGGDFMVGRHLTLQFFLSLCAIAVLLVPSDIELVNHNDRPSCISVVVFFALVGFLWNWGAGATWHMASMAQITPETWDERGYYLSQGGESPLYSAAYSYFRNRGKVTYRDELRGQRILCAHLNGDKGLCFGAQEETLRNLKFHPKVLFGRDIFAASDFDMYLTDVIALQDPLLARLKVEPMSPWRVGHIERRVPLGYQETIAAGENRIVNASLHEYYDKLLLVMKGPLWDWERFQTIVNFNMGRYDYLLRQYEDEANDASSGRGK